MAQFMFYVSKGQGSGRKQDTSQPAESSHLTKKSKQPIERKVEFTSHIKLAQVAVNSFTEI